MVGGNMSLPLQALLGLILWSVWFISMYGILSLACILLPVHTGFGLTWINIALFVLTFALIILLTLLAYRLWQSTRKSTRLPPYARFLAWLGLAGYCIAAMATISIGAMALIYPPCL